MLSKTGTIEARKTTDSPLLALAAATMRPVCLDEQTCYTLTPFRPPVRLSVRSLTPALPDIYVANDPRSRFVGRRGKGQRKGGTGRGRERHGSWSGSVPSGPIYQATAPFGRRWAQQLLFELHGRTYLYVFSGQLPNDRVFTNKVCRIELTDEVHFLPPQSFSQAPPSSKSSCRVGVSTVQNVEIVDVKGKGKDKGKSKGRSLGDHPPAAAASSGSTSSATHPFVVAPIVAGHRVVRIGQEAFQFGGVESHFSDHLNRIFKFDLVTLVWREVTPVTGTPPAAREGHSMNVVGSQEHGRFIYIAGGCLRIPEFQMFRFDVSKSHWESLSTRDIMSDDDDPAEADAADAPGRWCPTARFYHWTVWWRKKDYLLMFGGWKKKSSARSTVDKFYVYDIARQGFREPIDATPTPYATYGLSEFEAKLISDRYIVTLFGRQNGPRGTTPPARVHVAASMFDLETRRWFVTNCVDHKRMPMGTLVPIVPKDPADSDSVKPYEKLADAIAHGDPDRPYRAGHCVSVLHNNTFVVTGSANAREVERGVWQGDLLFIRTNFPSDEDDLALRSGGACRDENLRIRQRMRANETWSDIEVEIQ